MGDGGAGERGESRQARGEPQPDPVGSSGVEITPQSCSQLVAKKLDFYPPPPVRHWLRARWEGHKPPGSSGFLSCGKEAPIACVCVLVAQSCPAFCNCMNCSNPLPARRLCPWDSSGKSTAVGCLSLLQGNLPNPGIEHWSPALQNLHSQILYHLSHQGGPVACGGPLRNSQSQAEFTET